MEKEFVPYPLALRMKALGFDESCFGYYNTDPVFKNPVFNLDKPFDHEWCLPVPTWGQAFKWFRDEHSLTFTIDDFYTYTESKLRFEYSIRTIGSQEDNPQGVFEKYEQAELACLEKLLDIVETKLKEDAEEDNIG
jgi:hypothetical protein